MHPDLLVEPLLYFPTEIIVWQRYSECMRLLEEKLLPASNLFCYGQVESRYGSGQLFRDLNKNFETSTIKSQFRKLKIETFPQLKNFFQEENNYARRHQLNSWIKRYCWWIKTEVRRHRIGLFHHYLWTVDYKQLNEIAAFGGFPTRYPHWRWGMEYEKLSKSYTYGLSVIYEMVINNDPCYAYLLRSNSLVSQKQIAHVFAHADFLK